MRWVVRGLVALVALVVVAVAALAVLLPRLAAREDVQRRIEARAEALLGRDVGWDALSVGLLPPSLVLRNASVAEEGGLAASAEDVRLRLALLPLFRGDVVVDSLVVDGISAVSEAPGAEPPTVFELDGSGGRVRIRARAPSLDRVELDVGIDGARISGRGLEGELAGRLRAELARPEAAPGKASGPALAPVSVSLERGRVRVVRDGAVLVLEELAGQARAESAGAPLVFDAAGRLAEGGTLRARGEARSGAEPPTLDATVDLVAVPLAPLAAFAGAADSVAGGTASGTVEVRGSAASLDALVARLDLAEASLRPDGIALAGPLAVQADLAGPPDRLGGTFAIDATQATLDYGDTLHKPPGTRATVTGRLAPQPDGSLGLDGVKLQLADADARVSARFGERDRRVELAAAPFDLSGWEALLPSWRGGPLAGRVAVPKLLVRLAPLRLEGRTELSQVAFTAPGRGRVSLDGTLRADGSDALATDALAVSLAGQPPFRVRGRIAGLAGRPGYDLRVATPRPPEVNALLTSFASLPDVLTGPLRLEGRVQGPLAGDTPALDAAQGSFELTVGGADLGGGRIQGVSLLRGVVERLGALGAFAVVAGRELGGRDLQRFYDDHFQVIGGTFDLAGGVVRTPDLRLVYRDYRADLRGTVDLHDLALDLAGELTIDPAVDAALADRSSGSQRVIPLARVGGTLEQPRVEISAETVARLAASWASAEDRAHLEKQVDKALGTEGAGREIFDALEGVLRKRSE